MKNGQKNLHVPLPDELYSRLRQISGSARRPATEVAREAIRKYLDEKEREELDEGIREYARKAAGTRDDLDPDLEAAAVENLVRTGKERKR